MAVNSYVVLARKWRPSQFSDIVGQTHVVRTLMNAVRSKRLHHAYLFTGSRGIGKTSIARIFAKSLRCPSLRTATIESEEWLQSCDECSNCREIAQSSSVDVIEIDGASNNGVDAVREIRENAKFLPSSGERKIYIIDEVHMLTTAAFNALLKTLEEPPPHVIFIFATTEPHKIPATILSRVQRFDFKRVTLAQTQSRLAQVTQSEGIECEQAALALVARAAEGSMRDALSLLDQVIAFSGNKITAQAVRDSIGLIEGQTLLGVLRSIAERNSLRAIGYIEAAYQQGHDLRVLAKSLIEYVHAAILAKVGSTHSVTLELSEDEWTEVKQISELRSLEELELIFQVLNHGVDWIARSSQPKAVLDVLLIKCASAEILSRPYESEAASTQSEEVQAPPRRPVPSVSDIQSPSTSLAATPPPATEAPKTWPSTVDYVKKFRPLLASILEHAVEAQVPSKENPVLTIYFKQEDSYKAEQLSSPLHSKQLEALSKEYFGFDLRIKVECNSSVSGESLAAKRVREIQEKEHQARESVQNHPIIREAKALFGGELGPIELTPSSPQDPHSNATT